MSNDAEEVMEVVEGEEAEMGVLEALKEVFKKAALYDGLRRGIHEYDENLFAIDS